MAGDANTFRKSSLSLLAAEIGSLKKSIGIVIKATRAYKNTGSGRPDGLLQKDVAAAAGTSAGTISQIENGNHIPPNPRLRHVLRESGFDLNQPGGQALEALMRTIRDAERHLKHLIHEAP